MPPGHLFRPLRPPGHLDSKLIVVFRGWHDETEERHWGVSNNCSKSTQSKAILNILDTRFYLGRGVPQLQCCCDLQNMVWFQKRRERKTFSVHGINHKLSIFFNFLGLIFKASLSWSYVKFVIQESGFSLSLIITVQRESAPVKEYLRTKSKWESHKIFLSFSWLISEKHFFFDKCQTSEPNHPLS